MGGNLEKACESVISLQPPMYMIFLRYSLYQYWVELIHFIISLSVKPVQWYVKVGSYFLRNKVSLFTLILLAAGRYDKNFQLSMGQSLYKLVVHIPCIVM